MLTYGNHAIDCCMKGIASEATDHEPEVPTPAEAERRAFAWAKKYPEAFAALGES